MSADEPLPTSVTECAPFFPQDGFGLPDMGPMNLQLLERSRIPVRPVVTALLPVLVVGAALLSSAPPAAATSATDFAATAAPLSYGGYDYDDLLDSADAGSVYLPADQYGPTSVKSDGTVVPGIPGGPGLHDFDVALARFGDSYVTMYVDSAMLEFFDGGPYARTCSGFESLIAAIYSGYFTVACDNFSTSILTANGGTEDFTFAGYGNFVNAGTVTAVTGYADPALTYVGVPPADPPDPAYYASATPLSFAGVSYDEIVGNDSEPESADSSAFDAQLAASAPELGVVWIVDFEAGPQVVTEDNTAISGIPDDDSQDAIDAILLAINGGHLTGYLSSAWRTDGPTGPYAATCAEFIAFLADNGSPETMTCDNFKPAIFTPNGAGEDFTFTGLDGFENEGAVSAVEGFSAPAWLTHGPYTPPAPTTTSTAPAATTTTAASTTTAAPTTTTAPPTTTAAPATTAPVAATLPATGSGDSRAAALLAVALLGAGAALLRSSRDRTASSAFARAGRATHRR